MKEFKGRSNIKIYNADCMEYLKDMKDNEFDLSLIDPPYGIGVNKMTLGNRNKKRSLHRGGNNWDLIAPNEEYFDFIKQKSNNQIIFGANHFLDSMPFNLNSSGWIFWDKGTGKNDFADGELAWTSFDKTVKKYFQSWVGANAKEKTQKTRIHITQKPVQLYKWLLQNYAKEGDTILDTHLGSGSIAIACWDLGYDLTAFEIDKDYFDAAVKRIELHTQQEQMYAPEEIKQPEQKDLF